ncbi:hypothetical protein L916_21776 [Phytophthora nicotianae]|uniref:Uncharacterized protein n=1 Tax=Phytophthora nicotianae TaxID=4792 RepID=W2HQL8_PHYNI|nr:hypothetical protein L916_21776 [Phytophthora nicotianae]
MTLVLDGNLRVFRVLPSGISSMISTLGSWSIAMIITREMPLEMIL